MSVTLPLQPDVVREKFLHLVTRCAGFPYVWGGKGADFVFDIQQRRLVKNPYSVPVFDCSGLVTDCWFRATGQDVRGAHSAQTLADTLTGKTRKPSEDSELGCLLFFGENVKSIGHVAVGLGPGWGVRKMLVIEAAGGDHRTLRPTQNARVFVGQPVRKDYLFSLRLPFGDEI